MKNQKFKKIEIEGVIYEYIITEENTIRLKGVVPYRPYMAIKEKLIKDGIYKPNKSGNV